MLVFSASLVSLNPWAARFLFLEHTSFPQNQRLAHWNTSQGPSALLLDQSPAVGPGGAAVLPRPLGQPNGPVSHSSAGLVAALLILRILSLFTASEPLLEHLLLLRRPFPPSPAVLRAPGLHGALLLFPPQQLASVTLGNWTGTEEGRSLDPGDFMLYAWYRWPPLPLWVKSAYLWGIWFGQTLCGVLPVFPLPWLRGYFFYYTFTLTGNIFMVIKVIILLLSSFSCVQLCNPMDCGPPGSSVHGIYPTRILEQVAISSSRGSSQPSSWTRVSCVFCFGRCILYH